MRSGPRRTAPRVRGGRVDKKNNWAPDHGDYFAVPQAEIRLDRRDPGPGYRHVITVAQLRRFIELLPDWGEIAVGLNAIVLDRGGVELGWYDHGVVGLCAWDVGYHWDSVDTPWLDSNAEALSLLDVNVEPRGDRFKLHWTEPQARAFMLLDVLPHELGHHHDLLTTRTKRVSRGEPFAEQYARRVREAVWPSYATSFKL